jgi:hypothetical protein
VYNFRLFSLYISRKICYNSNNLNLNYFLHRAESKGNKKQMQKKSIAMAARLMAVALIVAAVGIQTPTVMAASVSSFSDTLSRLQVSTLANHDIRFVTPTGVDASTDTITLTFANFTMGTFALLNFDLNVSASSACTTFGTNKTLATTAASGTWGVAQSSQVITFTPPTNATTGEITAGRCVQILIGSNATTGGAGTTQITNPASAGTDTIAIGGVFGDSGTADIAIITDDEVNVTAAVQPSITFTISDVAIGFGNLSFSQATFANGAATGTTTDSASAHDMTVATNAASGYVLSYYGATLTKGADNIDAATFTNDADGTPGSEQFAIGFTADQGSTVTAAYDHNATAGNRDWSFVPSTTTTIVSRATPVGTETIGAYYLANISATSTAAGSYETNIDYIATASF